MAKGKKREPWPALAEEAPAVAELVAEVVLEAEEVAEAPAVEAPVPVEPTEVQLGSLSNAALFELKGERYRVADKGEKFSVVYKLKEASVAPGKTMWAVAGQATLANSTVVKPIK